MKRITVELAVVIVFVALTYLIPVQWLGSPREGSIGGLFAGLILARWIDELMGVKEG